MRLLNNITLWKKSAGSLIFLEEILTFAIITYFCKTNFLSFKVFYFISHPRRILIIKYDCLLHYKITENVYNSFTEKFKFLIYISASTCSFTVKIVDGTPDKISIHIFIVPDLTSVMR